MRILVTGATGQLGMDSVYCLNKVGYDVYGCTREQLDITDNQEVYEIINQVKPDVVLHTAAYTKVDDAELQPETAYRINAYGTRNVACACEQIGGKLVYISTDYVFDGKSSKPYNEFEAPSPIGVYGKSKLAGEQFVRQFSSRYFIVRTSWVYGAHGTNFVKTMLKMTKERNEIRVVYDQIGSPTYTVDLARFIGNLITTDLYGTYHASNSGSCSWYEFAKAIFEEAGISHVKVSPVTTNEFPRPAPRPPYSVMDNMAIRLNGFEPLPCWKESLEKLIKQLKS
ncbi:dTDP-4-dehydrorhamnose reductase [Aneurinibacillus sp. Ricciae_BoGa-3]|uniref:dTDP-4-dehydrorhamnose reductase n=1 Tax=Aneurinibacillus sp. Ricciae_BoGa-3 TaxID=3022697 RepID=UPI0023404AEF|nr:dTDP-4-dehydrorhamnose reductase [Aneurinibacillus sp. Ricciae_BoGa-3]WCK56169.1 dTDP-4-dehydrorhamnose reductase [Aneurinibacillus sp. Ricciae_BoGa-3]